MASSFGPTQVSMPAGRREFTLDTPASAIGAKLTVTNSGWPANTSALIEVFLSFDGGDTFVTGASTTLTDAMPPPPANKGGPAFTVGVGFPRKPSGVSVPTHCRAAITVNNPITSTVSAAWI